MSSQKDKYTWFHLYTILEKLSIMTKSCSVLLKGWEWNTGIDYKDVWEIFYGAGKHSVL